MKCWGFVKCHMHLVARAVAPDISQYDDVSLCHCGNVPQAHARRVVAAGGGGGRFRAKVWSHWILLLSQAHTQDRYPAATGGLV